jgi:hypothetical protein
MRARMRGGEDAHMISHCDVYAGLEIACAAAAGASLAWRPSPAAAQPSVAPVPSLPRRR